MKYYEVEIDIPEALEESFVDWLVPHMEEMVELPCFYKAERLEVLDAEIADTTRRFLCRYFYEADTDFNNYMEKYSEKMRGDLPEKWRSELKFSRRLGTYQEL